MSTRLSVTHSTWVTRAIKRIHFRSDDLSDFLGSEYTDRYIKLVFPKPGVIYPEPLEVRALRGTIPAEDMPDVRTYTALFPDVAAGTVAIDFFIHGDDGIAGPWAARAQPGDVLLINGPRGAYRPDPSADWHLLVGDESALPAVTATLGEIAPEAVARVILMVDAPGDEPDLALPSGATLTYVYRQQANSPERALLDAVASLEWPAGRVHAFVHGEAQEVMHGIRPLLLEERGLARDQVSISGYWHRGRTADAFRVWKSEFAAAEKAAAEKAAAERVQPAGL